MAREPIVRIMRTVRTTHELEDGDSGAARIFRRMARRRVRFNL